MQLRFHNLGPYQDAIDRRLQDWQRQGIGRRIWDKDHAVWSPVPVPELTDRLGWLTLPAEMEAELPGLQAFAEEVRREKFSQVLLLGMGGSSLAPEMFQSVFGASGQGLPLRILDSTHPRAVRSAHRFGDPARTLYLVSSKSGSTLETHSFFLYFWEEVSKLKAQPGRHFAAITDPGSSLSKLAAERRFCRVFPGSLEVGGRFSALSVFGLVPAALVGVDSARLLRHARQMAEQCGPALAVAENPGLWLGAALGELALAGRDKLTFIALPPLNGFAAWAEQLIAESTGKDGKGIVPVVDEPLEPGQTFSADRVFVQVVIKGWEDPQQSALSQLLIQAGHPLLAFELDDPSQLGGEFFRWEMAVAGAGAILGIQPFDQPNVQLAKDLAKKAMGKSEAAFGEEATVIRAGNLETAAPALESFLSLARAGDYLALQAFVSPEMELNMALQRLRAKLGRCVGRATTLGFGPRFLHSTGQLHKGRAAIGLFLQFIDETAEDLAVPHGGYSFGRLIAAQAQGDAVALHQSGGRVLRLCLGREPLAALDKLISRL